MNKHKFILSKVKQLLGSEVKLMQATLDNGTVIEAESWEAGEPVFIVTEEETIPLPEGSYTTEEGVQIVVQEEGIIAEVMKGDKPGEEEMSEEPKYVTHADLEKALNSFAEKLAAEKVEQAKEEPKQEAKEEKVEASKQEAEEAKQEAKEEATELSAEDMPAAKAIKPNPERESAKKHTNLFSQKRTKTTKDLVFAKIANIKKK